MALDEKETGTDPHQNPGPHPGRMAEVLTPHFTKATTELRCAVVAGDPDNIPYASIT